MKEKTYRRLSAYMGLYLIAVIIYLISFFHSGWLYGLDMDALYQMAEAYSIPYMLLVSTVIWGVLLFFMEVVKEFLRYWITEA